MPTNAVLTHKKATNITLSADVLQEAKELGINISKTCDQFLRDLIKQEKERRWLKDHAEYIAECNSLIERDGLPLEMYRNF